MPHLPDDHHDHDLELIAALAAGDAQGRVHAQATELVTRCPDCRTLRDDLVALSTALAAMPAPRRRRDYRLTPAQAAALSPTGWRRFLGVLGGSGFGFATPLGTAMATLGLAGLLLTTLPSMLPAGSGGTAAGPEAATSASSPAKIEMTAPSASSAASTHPQPQGEAPAASASGQAYAGVQATTGTRGAAATDEPGSAAGAAGDTSQAGATPVPEPDTAATSTTDAASARPADQTAVILAGLAILAGLGLVALRWTARRLS
jgi:hypothetical protein